ncbi:hypothetical protein ACJ73_00194 [Blastomyces percursus]|uniref:Uncharacterized protein n=1 Tax=Blastomyces percursus TaxID=1658174 RepID=A0A1J9QIT7_9EURO|nr:hypothetical protein ACJ73_00194 [Blastomyces percursus]
MAAFQLGKRTHIDGEGEYFMNVRTMMAEIPYFNVLGAPVVVCMTSTQGDIVKEAEIMPVETNFDRHQFAKTIVADESLGKSLAYAKASGDLLHQWRLTHLLGTTAGCYDFGNLNLHPLVNVIPQKFRDWLHAAWMLPR